MTRYSNIIRDLAAHASNNACHVETLHVFAKDASPRVGGGPQIRTAGMCKLHLAARPGGWGTNDHIQRWISRQPAKIYPQKRGNFFAGAETLCASSADPRSCHLSSKATLFDGRRIRQRVVFRGIF